MEAETGSGNLNLLQSRFDSEPEAQQPDSETVSEILVPGRNSDADSNGLRAAARVTSESAMAVTRTDRLRVDSS
eukprot:1437173-Rhodomonas_salina.1